MPGVVRGSRRRSVLALGALAAAVALGATALGAASGENRDTARAHAPEMRLPAAAVAGEVIPGSYLVTLRSGDPAQVAAEHAAFGVHVDRVFTLALRGYTARMSAAAARRVAQDVRVRAVVADRAVRAADEVSALPTADNDTVLNTAAQATPPGVTRVGADRSSARAGDGSGEVDADIAVLDTGIDLDHPDLNVVGGVDCVSEVPLPDRESTPEPSAGPTSSPSPAAVAASVGVPGLDPLGSFDDTRGHGTHIAGIAAARDNGVGVVGIAPGARLWAVRVLDEVGNGSLGTLICGIEWVTAHADVIEVANMSLSGLEADLGCADGALHEAICRSVSAGVTYTVAAGNAASDAANYSPATFDDVITVSALADYDGRPGGLTLAPLTCPGPDDTFAPFSNYGADVDLIAPGVCVRSTWLGGGYSTLTGTSQAAAHVAGAAALYRAAHPGATPAQVRAALVAAGSQQWSEDSDPDSDPDPLLDVASF